MFGTSRDLAAEQASYTSILVWREDRLGSITHTSNRCFRRMIVIGAIAVIRYAQRHGTRRPWSVRLLGRPAKVAAAALVNKNARTVWALMTSGERYREPPRTRGCEGQRSVDAQGRLKPQNRENLFRAVARRARAIGCDPVSAKGHHGQRHDKLHRKARHMAASTSENAALRKTHGRRRAVPTRPNCSRGRQ